MEFLINNSVEMTMSTMMMTMTCEVIS